MKKFRNVTLLTTVLSLFANLAPVSAGDWPQFMGPNGDGTSTEKGLARAWPTEGPKVLWRAALGPGYGGAAIQADKVYLMDRVNRQQDVLRCLDLATGKEDWSFAYDAPGPIDHDGSRSTPAVSDKFAYIIGPFGQLHCVDLKTHQAVWKKNLLSDYGAKRPNWAVTQSALIYKDLVIVAPQGNEIGIVALDQATGNERWHSGAIGAMAYGSPHLVKVHGVEQIVIVNNDGAAAVDAADGKVLWKYAHPCKIPIPNVTALADGRFFITGAYMAGSAVFQVSRQGSNWDAKELGKNSQIGGHCHPALFFQDHLYMLCNVNERSDGMVCFDQEAKVVWQTKSSPNLDKGGSILTADGIMYVMDGRTGELHIVEPSASGFKSLAKAKVLDGREIWGPLSLAGGKMVVRDQTQVKCLDVRASQ